MDSFLFSEQKQQVVELLLANISLKIENLNYFSILIQFLFRSEIPVECFLKQNDEWIPCFLFFTNEKLKLIRSKTKQKILSIYLLNNTRFQANHLQEVENIISITPYMQKTSLIKFPQEFQSKVILDVLRIILACNQIEMDLNNFSNINKSSELLDEKQFIAAMIIYHWARKTAKFKVNFNEKKVDLIIKQNKVIISSPPTIKTRIPIQLNFRIFKNLQDSKKFKIKTIGKTMDQKKEKSFEISCENEESRDYLISLISLKFRIPSLKFIHHLFSLNQGTNKIDNSNLFEWSSSIKFNTQKILQDMNILIGTQQLKLNIFLFYKKIPATILLEKDYFYIERLNGDNFKCKYEDATLLMNKKFTSVLLLEIQVNLNI
ncbi:hypothetical protein M0811_01730 [Anaeramoeba ignava]|uniref:Uncharacterized protein n=1 Tax=Anaeramoeba ignava TaxID=1746090 RepID=A0A9Q0R869_ANAIG|nr:hypothetical protein M0811_01730 [Anaeramoeba ignava]